MDRSSATYDDGNLYGGIWADILRELQRRRKPEHTRLRIRHFPLADDFSNAGRCGEYLAFYDSQPTQLG